MKKNRNSIIHRIFTLINPIKDVLLFLFLFLIFDFVWKLCIHDDDGILLVFHRDYTQSVAWLSQITADMVYWTIHSLLGNSNYKIDGTTLFFDNAYRFKLEVVWGCTGVKQMFMFTFIMLFCYGPRKAKYWFIPSAFVVLNLINVVRIAGTALIVRSGFPHWFISFNEWYNNRTWDTSPQTFHMFYVDWFQFFHYDVFRWLYYDGVMFILWLIWQEKFNIPHQQKIKKLAIDNDQLKNESSNNNNR